MNIYVYQTDTRPNLDYLQLTMNLNKEYCKELGYKYIFEKMIIKGKYFPNLYKIMMVKQLLDRLDNGIVIFLDADAWIYNPNIINKLINDLPDNKQGMFSRDPYLIKNTYINSGSFIIRINDYTKKMYSLLEKQAIDKPRWKKPTDQFYVSNFVFENKDDFIIYKPDLLNSSIGKGLRHCWGKNFSTCLINHYKDNDTVDETGKTIKNNEINVENYIDDKSYPNTSNEYEYKHP